MRRLFLFVLYGSVISFSIGLLLSACDPQDGESVTGVSFSQPESVVYEPTVVRELSVDDYLGEVCRDSIDERLTWEEFGELKGEYLHHLRGLEPPYEFLDLHDVMIDFQRALITEARELPKDRVATLAQIDSLVDLYTVPLGSGRESFAIRFERALSVLSDGSMAKFTERCN